MSEQKETAARQMVMAEAHRIFFRYKKFPLSKRLNEPFSSVLPLLPGENTGKSEDNP